MDKFLGSILLDWLSFKFLVIKYSTPKTIITATYYALPPNIQITRH